MRFLIVFAAFVAALVSGTTAAVADKRVALVIGNGAYTAVPALPNPSADADAIAAKLAEVGFEVIVQKDADRSGMNVAMGRFIERLEGADVGLFYYAGHGIQYEGRNYLIGTSATADNQFSLTGGSLALDEVITAMEAVTTTNIVFLDACRENPFVDDLKKALPATRSTLTNDGLAPVKTQQGKDTMIVYATASNNVAADGDGTHSPFATALLTHLIEPDVEVSLMVKRVIQSVRDATAYEQNPEILSAMAAEFYFKRSPQAPTPVVTPEPDPVAERLLSGEPKIVVELPGEGTKIGTFDTSRLAALDVEGAIEKAKVEAPVVKTPEMVEAELGLGQQDVMRIQTALNALGYDLGTIDGNFGGKSRAALKEFQVVNRVPQTGYLDDPTISAILKTFEEAPKTYDGKWRIEIYRKLMQNDPGWAEMSVGDVNHIASLDVSYRDGEFFVDKYNIYTFKPDEPFADFAARVNADGLVQFSGKISTHFPDANIRSPRLYGINLKLQLPKIMPYARTVKAVGNRFEPPVAFEVSMKRVKG